MFSVAYATVKRILKILISEKLIITEGSGRATKYRTGPAYDLFYPIDVEDYFSHEIIAPSPTELWIHWNLKKHCSCSMNRIT